LELMSDIYLEQEINPALLFPKGINLRKILVV